jgi:hypothetical protein
MATLVIRRDECQSLNPLIVAIRMELPVTMAIVISANFVLTDAYAVCLSHDEKRFVGRIYSTEWMLRKIEEESHDLHV